MPLGVLSSVNCIHRFLKCSVLVYSLVVKVILISNFRMKYFLTQGRIQNARCRAKLDFAHFYLFIFWLEFCACHWQFTFFNWFWYLRSFHVQIGSGLRIGLGHQTNRIILAEPRHSTLQVTITNLARHMALSRAKVIVYLFRKFCLFRLETLVNLVLIHLTYDSGTFITPE